MIITPVSLVKLSNLRIFNITWSSNKATAFEIKQIENFFYIRNFTAWYTRSFILMRIEVGLCCFFALGKMHLIKI